MEDLVESILDYIRADYTDYAIMINGEWGSGKTYFWNNKVRNKIESMQLNGKRYRTSATKDTNKKTILLNKKTSKNKVYTTIFKYNSSVTNNRIFSI